jgi:hypothetical protein
MAIKLDISPSSVVVYCDECGHWRAFAFTIAEGHVSASSHEERVHPQSVQARDAASKYRQRHADDSTIVRLDPDSRLHGTSRPVGAR